MRTGTLPKDSNKTCKCGFIFMPGMTVGILSKRDDFGRSKVVCLHCKEFKAITISKQALECLKCQ